MLANRGLQHLPRPAVVWLMRNVRIILLAFLAMIVGTASASAFAMPQTNAAWPTPHQLEARYADNTPQPYAMNYSDEAAQTLGVKDGRWEAFNTQSSDPLMPSLKGGIDHSGAMISLQWRPGQ
jgi:hypothetical protein